LKHATVFQKFDALKVGESFLLINDHDPIPLYYEMKAERGDIFEWKKIENGPETWQVEITKTGAAAVAQEKVEERNSEPAKEDIFVLNVTLLEPRLKHPTIFKHFDALNHGEAFQILNDHDPKPLYYQMIAERGPVFAWEYLQQGPQWWQVQITKNKQEGESVGSIAAKDIRKAEVFKKYGIDFCCGGKKSLKQACAEVNVDVAVVEAELDKAYTIEIKTPVIDFTRWEAGFLSDYIYNQHHLYFYQERPIISDLVDKVVGRHGEHFPVLFEVEKLYRLLEQELANHFMKEEKVLFPFIKELTQAKKTGDLSYLQDLPSVQHPVEMMEKDHDDAGGLLAEIRKATDNYTPPAGSCNSFNLLYKKLEALEADLHLHVHLENNILFPKALELEKEVNSRK
jgi:regulator of cell morphogenesis and NO signaling